MQQWDKVNRRGKAVSKGHLESVVTEHFNGSHFLRIIVDHFLVKRFDFIGDFSYPE